jgi:hypothetical protein
LVKAKAGKGRIEEKENLWWHWRFSAILYLLEHTTTQNKRFDCMFQ